MKQTTSSHSQIVVDKDILSDADLRGKVEQLNRLFKEIQAYKEAHREQRIGYYTLSLGSILNAYREGDISFDETINAIQATQSSAASAHPEVSTESSGSHLSESLSGLARQAAEKEQNQDQSEG